MRPAYDLLRAAPSRRASLRPAFRHLRALLNLYWRKLKSGDPHTTSTVTLLVLILCVGLNFALAPRPVVSDPGAVNRLAEAGPRSTSVRMLDSKPRSDTCEEQTWPYFDQRCLRGRDLPGKPVADATTPQNPAPNPQTKTEPHKLTSVGQPSSAPEATPPQPVTLHDVPLPQPRPNIEADEAELDDEDLPYPPYPPAYYGRHYGPDGRPLMYPPPRYMDPREARAWQRYEYHERRPPRRGRHELHIGGFRFRF